MPRRFPQSRDTANDGDSKVEMPNTPKYRPPGEPAVLEDVTIALVILQRDLAQHVSRLGYCNFVGEEEKPGSGQSAEKGARGVDIRLEYQEAKNQIETYDLVCRMKESDYLCPKCTGITFAGIQRPDTHTFTDASGERRNRSSGETSFESSDSMGRGGSSFNNNDGGYVHYETLEELGTSATVDKCRCCMLLWTALSHAFGGHPTVSNLWPKTVLRLHESFGQLGVFASYGSLEDVSLGLFYGPGAPDHPGDADPYLEAYDGKNSCLTALDPLSDESIWRLESWLDDCIDNHIECSHNMQRPLPTRVIDVGDPSGGNQPYLLTDTADIPPTAYIALSHCWGGIVPVQTRRANLSDHQRALPLASLPRTFRDAVTLTRRLDFRYLWIDSLCIVQDDSDDWAQESARMGDIYRHAVLTLAAASAANSAEGLLMPRDPDATALCNLVTTDGEMTLAYPSLDAGLDFVRTRGWALQELLLPPRVVHYTFSKFGGDRMMVWECQVGRMREDGESQWRDGRKRLLSMLWDESGTKESDGGKESDTGKTSPGVSKSAPITLHKGGISDSFESNETDGAISQTVPPDYPDFNQIWREVVTEFSYRDLTQVADRLPALSGIVALLQKKMEHAGVESSFAAGIYIGQELMHYLMWTSPLPERKTIPHPSKSKSRALDVSPSWSWASAAGTVKWYDCTLLRHGFHSPQSWEQSYDDDLPPGVPEIHPFAAELVDFNLELENNHNPFGRVLSGGYIKICGKLREARVRPPSLRHGLRNLAAVKVPVIFKDVEAPKDAYAHYGSLTERDATRVWQVIDFILAKKVESASLSSEIRVDTRESTAAAQLTLVFQEMLISYAAVERTLQGLTDQLAVHPAADEEERLERCVRIANSMKAQLPLFYEANKRGYVEEALENWESVIMTHISTPVDLLYPYLYLQSLMNDATIDTIIRHQKFGKTKKPSPSIVELASDDWPPLELLHLPRCYPRFEGGEEYRQEFPNLIYRYPHRDLINVFFDEGVWDSENPIVDGIYCLLLADRCECGNYNAPNGLALVRCGKSDGEHIFQRVGVFFVPDFQGRRSNRIAREAFRGAEKTIVKIV